MDTQIKKYYYSFVFGWKFFYKNINMLFIFLLLSFVYFIGVAFTFIMIKLFGKEIIDSNKSQKSNWNEVSQNFEKVNYYRQF